MSVLPSQCLSYINGRYCVANKNNKTRQNIFPATGQIINSIEYASVAEVKLAVSAAETAYQVWSEMSVNERSNILLEAAKLLRERVQAIAELEVWDTGKPISEALSVDVISAADTLEYFAKAALAYESKLIPNRNALIYTLQEPLGVCVGIGAWNYPIQIACWKSAPALMMGNSMVYKPSELTPMTSLVLAEIFTEAGMPAGVFNVVLGDGEVAEQLLAQDGIAKVSFTGSVPTGRQVANAAANKLIPATLELGGKSPLIIFEDADIEQAVYGAMLANFYTQGEICSNGTRVFVHKKIQQSFLDALLTKVTSLRIGDPFSVETQIGSLISRQHVEKVMKYIEAGKQAGASLLCGGKQLAQPPFDKGCFVEPTIFSDCTDEMTIVQEEIFGPVMSVLAFESDSEAVRRANATSFGLSAGLFTRDVKRAHHISKQLKAGVCWVNNYNVTPVSMPFGGYKQSGMGRENGFDTLSQYTQTKSIYVELGAIDHPY